IACSRIRRVCTIGQAPFCLIVSRALEQRIALEFAFDIGGKVQIGELQQLDGLHQLRRHHEGMALPKFESLGKRHGRYSAAFLLTTVTDRVALSVGPLLAYGVPGVMYTRTRGRSLRVEQRG